MSPLIPIAAAAIGTALVAGCGNDASTSTSTPPPDSAATGAVSPGPPPTSSAVSTPTVPPAGGPTVQGTTYTLVLPHGWEPFAADLTNQRNFKDTNGTGSGSIFEDAGAAPGGATTAALASLARRALKRLPDNEKGQRLPNVTVAGVPFCHVEGTSKYAADEEYDTVVGTIELRVTLSWQSYVSKPPTSRQRGVNAQLLAGLKLKL